jgi:uncharacterized lipoprotein YehR (DUF1307 family)
MKLDTVLTHSIVAIILAVSLSGCDSWNLRPTDPTSPPVIQYKYEKQSVPSDHLTIPRQPDKLDVKNATQKDVAKWVLDSESRMMTLEDQLRAIKKWNDEKEVK